MPFERELLAAARDYRHWERVSDRANWAPQMCKIPPMAGVQRSASSDADTHGRKLYFLFAKDAATYKGLPFLDDTAEVHEQTAGKLEGQVVVKQSWLPVEMRVAEVPKIKPKTLGGHVIPEDHVIDGERAFRTGAADALFVMLKLDAKTEGTDAGWVYGTLTADGSKVTASGRIASCMECHESAPHDRLFGMSPPFSKRASKPAKR